MLDYLARQLERGSLHGVRCVPASDQTASEAAFHGVPLTSLQEHPVVRTPPPVLSVSDCRTVKKKAQDSLVSR